MKKHFLAIFFAATTILFAYLWWAKDRPVEIIIPDAIKTVTGDSTAVPDTVVKVVTEFVDRVKTVTRTVVEKVKVVERDTITVTKLVKPKSGGWSYLSSKDFKFDYLDANVFGFAPASIDSLGIDYKIYFDKYYQDKYDPIIQARFRQEKRKKWYWGLVGIGIGAFAWELAR